MQDPPKTVPQNLDEVSPHLPPTPHERRAKAQGRSLKAHLSWIVPAVSAQAARRFLEAKGVKVGRVVLRATPDSALVSTRYQLFEVFRAK